MPTRTVGRHQSTLSCAHDEGNQYDQYAVAIKSADATLVGHVPLENSRVFYFFIKHGGTITATVTGNRMNRGSGYGLEVS